jgi:ABC-type protease/lipase transport system fused ATPase/permease subunit
MFIKLLQINPHLKRLALVILVFSSFANILLLVLPLYSLQIIDRVISSNNLETLMVLCVIVVASLIAMTLLNIAKNKVILFASNVIYRNFITGIIDNIAAINQQKDKYNLASLNRDIEQLRNFITSSAFSNILDLPWGLIFILVLMLINFWVGIFVFFAAIIMLVISYFYEMRGHNNKKNLAFEQKKKISLIDIISGNNFAIDVVGMKANLKNALDIELKEKIDANQEITAESGDVSSYVKLMRLLVQVVIMTISAYLVLDNKLTMGGMIASSMIAGKALQPFDILVNSWRHLVMMKETFAKVSKFYSNLHAAKSIKIDISKSDKLLFDQVLMGKNGKEASRKITFTANNSEILVIKGADITVKSAICKAIAGKNRLQHAYIKIGEMDYNHFLANGGSAYIAYIGDIYRAMPASIKDNITCFANEVDLEKFNYIINELSLFDDINKLENSFDTILDSTQLNNITRSKFYFIGIAAALYNNSKILVIESPEKYFDEIDMNAFKVALNIAKKQNMIIIISSNNSHIIELSDLVIEV